MSYQQLVYTQYLVSKGFNVITFDWRGFGESGEWQMNTDYLVYTVLLLDYDAVIQKTLQHPEVDTSAIAILAGQPMLIFLWLLQVSIIMLKRLSELDWWQLLMKFILF